MLAATAYSDERLCDGNALKLRRSETFGEVSSLASSQTDNRKAPFAVGGTSLAVSYLSLGVASDLPCGTRRGGARNRANRESHELTARQVANLIAAARHAEAIGLPLTRMITIHWQSAGVPLDRMVKATGRYIDLLSKTLARHSSTTAWLCVHENGHGKGGHCHLLAHVPGQLVKHVTGLQRGWLRGITGQPYQARVILSKPIGGRLGLERSNPDLHASNAGAALAYVLKGARPAAAVQFNLELLEPGGRIIGRRCSTSQNISAKAREKGSAK